MKPYSSRLWYTKLKREDQDNYLSLMMSEEVMRFITSKALSHNKAVNRFNGVLQTNEEGTPFGTYGVYSMLGRDFMGIAKFVSTDDTTAEIGYALLPDYWGKGFGTEISEALVDFGKSIDTLNLLEATIDPQNDASKKILEKCQFRFYGMRKVYNLPGEVYQLKIK